MSKFSKVGLKAFLLACSITPFSFVEGKQTCTIANPSRFDVKHRDPRGVGYTEGYTTIAGFWTLDGVRNALPFLDVRGHVFNNGNLAANIGFGGRFLTRSTWILGGNLFYDYRNESGPFHQVGVGLEGLHPKFDLRLNGYIPFGHGKEFGDRYFSHFSVNKIYVSREVKVSIPSIYAEVGVPIKGIFAPIELYLAAGPYYLFKKSIDCDNFNGSFGGKLRLSFKVFDGMSIGADYTYDDIFQSNLQGYLSFSFPWNSVNMRRHGARFKDNFPAGKCHDDAVHVARMAQSVERNEIIPIRTQAPPCVVRGANGQIERILFVNNQESGGDGTLASPYGTLAQAQDNSEPGDIIYLFYGNGTSVGQSNGIVLKPGQRLVSSGVSFVIDTDQGPLRINARQPGLLPKLDNPATPVVSLSGDQGSLNQVIGFEFINIAGVDTISVAAPGDNLIHAIRSNKFQGDNGGIPISLTVGSGYRGSITNNITEGATGPSANIVMGGGGTLLMSLNNFQSDSGAVIAVNSGGAIDGTFIQNTIKRGASVPATGISVVGMTGTSTLTFTNNPMDGGTTLFTSQAILADWTGNLTFNGSGNTIAAAPTGAGGIVFSQDGGNVLNATINGNNKFITSAAGVNFGTNPFSGNIVVDGNTFGEGGSNISAIIVDNMTSGSFTASNNIITNTPGGESAIVVGANGLELETFNVTGNNISGGGQIGIHIQGTLKTGERLISDNEITGLVSGIVAETGAFSGGGTYTIRNNTITAVSGGTGISLDQTGGILNIIGNTISGDGAGAAINITTLDGVTATISGSTIQGIENGMLISSVVNGSELIIQDNPNISVSDIGVQIGSQNGGALQITGNTIASGSGAAVNITTAGSPTILFRNKNNLGSNGIVNLVITGSPLGTPVSLDFGGAIGADQGNTGNTGNLNSAGAALPADLNITNVSTEAELTQVNTFDTINVNSNLTFISRDGKKVEQ